MIIQRLIVAYKSPASSSWECFWWRVAVNGENVFKAVISHTEYSVLEIMLVHLQFMNQ